MVVLVLMLRSLLPEGRGTNSPLAVWKNTLIMLLAPVLHLLMYIKTNQNILLINNKLLQYKTTVNNNHVIYYITANTNVGWKWISCHTDTSFHLSPCVPIDSPWSTYTAATGIKWQVRGSFIYCCSTYVFTIIWYSDICRIVLNCMCLSLNAFVFAVNRNPKIEQQCCR